MYTVEKRTVRKSGKLPVSRRSYYFPTYATVTKLGVWCVMKEGKVFAEARGKGKAVLIASSLNSQSENQNEPNKTN